MNYNRSAIEIESPEEFGYEKIKFNLTESSISDEKLSDLNIDLGRLLVAYGDHRGHEKLRKLIADDAGVDPTDVLLTAGAAMGIFIVLTSLLKENNRLIVVHPNYATNIDVARSIGAKIDLIHLKFEENFRLNIEQIEEAFVENETKLLSVTVPNNPTGVVVSRQQLDRLISISEQRSVPLFVDETYREMTFREKLPVAASLSPRAISLSSLSKSYGMPGIRVGWLICQDKLLMNKLLAAKEQIMICGSIVDEEIASISFRNRFISNDGEFLRLYRLPSE